MLIHPYQLIVRADVTFHFALTRPSKHFPAWTGTATHFGLGVSYLAVQARSKISVWLVPVDKTQNFFLHLTLVTVINSVQITASN